MRSPAELLNLHITGEFVSSPVKLVNLCLPGKFVRPPAEFVSLLAEFMRSAAQSASLLVDWN